VFFDCAGSELQRRYSETAPSSAGLDRPAIDGIAAERQLMEPLRRWSDHIIDTTDTDSNALQQQVRQRFATGRRGTTLHVMSFGFARGLPRNADNVFDMRFLRNPHWVDQLRRLTGLDQAVGAYVATDPAYEDAVGRIEELLLILLPRYEAEGKSYVSIAFGCTGGRHRSVHVAERVAARLREAGFSLTIEHRDLGTLPRDVIEGAQRAERSVKVFDDRFGAGDPWPARVRVHHGDGACGRAAGADRGDLHRPRRRHGSAPQRHRRGDRAGRRGRGVIILTDLFGGTPSNLAISLMKPSRSR
jgi:hypothetical protein